MFSIVPQGVFSSGGDVQEIIGPLTKMNMKELLTFIRMTGDLVSAMINWGKSIISAVEGICAGAIISKASHFAARNDDIIISSGYNIAGPGGEAALLSHPDVVECGVIGIVDEYRGSIVQAHFVLTSNIPRAMQGRSKQ